MFAASFDTLEAAVATGGGIGEVRAEIGAVKAELRAVRRALGFVFAIVLVIAARQFGVVQGHACIPSPRRGRPAACNGDMTKPIPESAGGDSTEEFGCLIECWKTSKAMTFR